MYPDDSETARRLLPGLKTDASMLMNQWPTAPGTLPFSGSHSGDVDDTGYICMVGNLMLTRPLAEAERIGPFIFKMEGGGLRFDLDTVGSKVEFHLLDGTPASFVTSFSQGDVRHVMETYEQLEPHWFLARYSVVEV